MNENTQAVSAPKSPKIYARLVRGSTYYLRDKQFVAGKEVVVTAEERAHLEEHAVDVVTIPAAEDEYPDNELRAKFEFRVEGEQPPAPRRRQRPAG